MSERRAPQLRGLAPLTPLMAEAHQLATRRGRVAVDQETWRRAVGERVARRALPVALRRGSLLVRVATAAWAQELSFLTGELRTRLQACGVEVQELRFVVGAVEPPPASRPLQPPPAPLAPLPAALAARLELIDDPELRAALEGAARRSLTPR